MKNSHEELCVKVASAFCSVLSRWLTKKQLREVVFKNATPDYKNCCATHDYCDSNMAMDEALTKCGVKLWTARGTLSVRATNIFNEAWSLAKKSQFTL